MLVAMCADKGAPGVTTTALAVAALWPRPVVLVESDPSGGDLAVRAEAEHGAPLAPQPSLLTLAAAARGNRDSPPVAPTAHAQQLPGGLVVVPAPTSPDQLGGMGALWTQLAQVCAGSEVDVIADVGRVWDASPALPLVAAADRVLLLAPATVEGLVHLKHRAMNLLPTAPPGGLGVAVLAPARSGPADAAAAAQVLEDAGCPAPVHGYVAYDSRGAAALYAGRTGRRWRYTGLARSMDPIAAALVAPTTGRVTRTADQEEGTR